MWRAFFTALLLALPLRCPAQEQGGSFMRHLFVAVAVDGLLFVSKSDDLPYTIRVVGGEKDTARSGDGQMYAGTKDYLFQNLVVPVGDLKMSKADATDAKKVLAAHADWECKSMNNITRQSLTARPEFEQVNGRIWAHWSYDLSDFFKTLKAEKPEVVTGPTPELQHFLTTTVGPYIVVLPTDDRNNHHDAVATKEALLRLARTFAVHPKPLTHEQLRDLASQPQP